MGFSKEENGLQGEMQISVKDMMCNDKEILDRLASCGILDRLRWGHQIVKFALSGTWEEGFMKLLENT